MVNEPVKKGVIDNVVSLKKWGASPVIIHGGGPVIRDLLELAKIESKFVEGHRVTDARAMQFIEMALSGKVNGELVTLINKTEAKAVGISGKDGRMVTAKKRVHKKENNEIDLGFVGDVETVNPELVKSLIADNFIPVISPVSMDKKGDTYNINADMFAGHIAGALSAKHYVALTDVDGILSDKDDPSSLIETMTVADAKTEAGHLIQGGMIPKTESCIIALQNGVESAHIINGMKPDSLLKELTSNKKCGTLITS